VLQHAELSNRIGVLKLKLPMDIETIQNMLGLFHDGTALRDSERLSRFQEFP
jgi:hypothetical protein